jgi:hypothetical protein
VTLSAFGDKKHPPTDPELQEVLGRAYAAWSDLPAMLEARLGPATHAWGYAGRPYGWALRVLLKKRVILYMTPQPQQFLVAFALGEKAVHAVQAARLPTNVLQAIEAAPRYAEGRGVRFEITGRRQLAPLVRLAVIKNGN